MKTYKYALEDAESTEGLIGDMVSCGKRIKNMFLSGIVIVVDGRSKTVIGLG